MGLLRWTVGVISGMGPVDRAIDKAVEDAFSLFESGATEGTITVRENDLGIRNPIDAVLPMIVTGLQNSGITVRGVQRPDWSNAAYIQVATPRGEPSYPAARRADVRPMLDPEPVRQIPQPRSAVMSPFSQPSSNPAWDQRFSDAWNARESDPGHSLSQLGALLVDCPPGQAYHNFLDALIIEVVPEISGSVGLRSPYGTEDNTPALRKTLEDLVTALSTLAEPADPVEQGNYWQLAGMASVALLSLSTAAGDADTVGRSRESARNLLAAIPREGKSYKVARFEKEFFDDGGEIASENSRG